MPDAVDVGGFPDRQALVINAWLHPADVVSHDEENVGLSALRGSRCRCSESRQTCSENRGHGSHRFWPMTAACCAALVFSECNHTHLLSSSNENSPHLCPHAVTIL